MVSAYPGTRLVNSPLLLMVSGLHIRFESKVGFSSRNGIRWNWNSSRNLTLKELELEFDGI